MYISQSQFTGKLALFRMAKTVTLNTLKDVQNEFMKATKGRKIDNILFDLREVTDTDTAGVAGLIDLLKDMKHRGKSGRVGLIHLSEKMRAHLKMTNTQDTFKEYASEQEAVEDLSR